jgi:hypothetical protein
VSERDILVRLALVSLVALVAAWFGVVGPKRSDASKQSDRVSAAQQKLSDAQQQLTAGRQAQAHATENRLVLSELRAALPDSAGAAALLRQLNGTSNNDSVAFRTASIATSGAAPAAAPATGTGTGADLPPGATIGPGNLPVLDLTLTFDGRYLRLTSLLDRLRRFVSMSGDKVTAHGRLLSVEGFQLGPVGSGPKVTATLAATAYLAPLPGTTVTTPSTGAPTGTATTTPSSASSGTTTTASAGGAP